MEGFRRIVIMKTILVLFIIFVLDLGYCFAQKVTNISVEQLGQSIQVSYNLETELPCNVSLYYSIDNGAKWQGPLQKVGGDVGEKIISGNKKIFWDVLIEVDQFKFEGVVFKVEARLMGLKEVKIGNQIWSAENLNVDRYSNGDTIPQVTDATTWSNMTTGAWCYYNNDSTNGPIYGKLYNCYSVADSRGLCPTGWHVPSDDEWSTLLKYLGGYSLAGGKMKEVGLTLWASPNNGATNSSGFTGRPGGFRSEYNAYYDFGNRGYWWSATKLSTTDAKGCILYYNHSYLGIDSFVRPENYGLSVRCVRD
jgi:uncharacterized protein (TIGR02145 family)